MADLKYTSCGSVANLRTQFNALVDDYDDLRAKLIDLHQKLDSDGGITDTDYETAVAPASKTSGDLVSD